MNKYEVIVEMQELYKNKKKNLGQNSLSLPKFIQQYVGN